MAKLSREEKEKIVENLKEKISASEAFVVTDYHGLSVPQMQELKKSLKETSAEFNVAKNTLIKLGAKQAKQEVDTESLAGPTAILFAKKDPIEAIKKLAEFIKQNKLPNVKSGVLDGEVLTKDNILALSRIPGRGELYAKVVGSLNSPIAGIVGVLNANLRNLVLVLSEIQKAKGGAS